MLTTQGEETMGEAIRVGILGTGGASRALHGPAILRVPGLTLHGVCGRSLTKAKAICDELAPEAKAFDDFDRMLADGSLDAVIIANPDGLHAEAAVKAANAGKSVLLEKPMGLSVPECERIIDAFAGSKAKLAVGYRMRFHLGHQQVMRRVHAGEFGQLRLVRAHAAIADKGDAAWRNEEGLGKWWTLSKFGTHLIDQTIWAANRPVSSISHFASSVRKRPGANDAEACGTWTYDDGPMIQLFCSNLWTSQCRFELHCQDASIYLTGSLGFDGGGTISIGDEVVNFESRPQFDAQLEDFQRAIREDRDPLCGGDLGLENVRILEMFTEQSKEVQP